jgi:rhamnosyltransferase
VTDSGKTVLAIVVTYFPKSKVLRPLLKSLSLQVTELLVVDNSPREDSSAWQAILPLTADMTNIRLVRFGENRGIAAGLNVGIDCALEEGFDFALLSDQDSLPDPDMVRVLVNVAMERQSVGKHVASVCPQYFDQTTNATAPFQVQPPERIFYSRVDSDQARPWLEIVTSITSGSLLTRDAMQKVGRMREDFFIDHVDTEWSHRARSMGYANYGTAQTRLTHELGDEVFWLWYFGWHASSVYSPLRLYYRFRNFVLLWRLRHVPKRWVLRASWFWLGNFYAHAIFAPGRAANLRMMLRGLWDGLCNRTGKFANTTSPPLGPP